MMTCHYENFLCKFQTLFNSLSLGMIVSAYDLAIVSQAFFLTAMIVVGLTMYTLQSNKDFQWLSGVLYSALMILSLGSLLHVIIEFFKRRKIQFHVNLHFEIIFLQIFFRNSAMESALSMLGAFVFAGYIIYDTQMIMKHLCPEEYVIAVLNLYMDIINLFIKILRILNSMKETNERSSESRKKKRND